MRENSLQEAPTKTEALILQGPRKRKHVVFKMSETDIIPKKRSSIKASEMTLNDLQYPCTANNQEGGEKHDRTDESAIKRRRAGFLQKEGVVFSHAF